MFLMVFDPFARLRHSKTLSPSRRHFLRSSRTFSCCSRSSFFSRWYLKYGPRSLA